MEDIIILKGLEILLQAGWLLFSEVSDGLERTCLLICKESRDYTPRNALVTDATPPSLWRGSCQCTPGTHPDNANTDSDERGKRAVNGSITMAVAAEHTERQLGDAGVTSPSSRKSAWEFDASTGGEIAVAESVGDTLVSPNRVPAVRVGGIKWKRTTLDLLAPSFAWPAGLKMLTFVNPLGSWSRIPLPESLEELDVSSSWSPADEVACLGWPRGLKRLTLNRLWNRPLGVSDDMFPKALEELTFGGDFNQPLGTDKVALPPRLRELSLGYKFNQPLAGVRWPSGLVRLRLSREFNQVLEAVCWPPTLREICLGDSFNRSLMNVKFPDGLEVLALGSNFNHPLRNSRTGRSCLPRGLKTLRLGCKYIEVSNACSSLPEDLQELECTGLSCFRRVVHWPRGLRSLEFVDLNWKVLVLPPRLERFVVKHFNGSIMGNVLPRTLKVLELYVSPCLNFDFAHLPDGLEELVYLLHISKYKRTSSGLPRGPRLPRWLPRSLKRVKITCDYTTDASWSTLEWPPGLKELHLDVFAHGQVVSPLMDVSLPHSLEVLSLGCSFKWSLRPVELPHSLQRLAMTWGYPVSHLQRREWPPQMKVVEIGLQMFLFDRGTPSRPPAELIMEEPGVEVKSE